MKLIYGDRKQTSSCLNGYIKAEREERSEVTQSCPTLCDPMDYSLQGSSVHGISQTKVLEQVAISSFMGYP